jgi:hypothetical protein
MQPAAKFSWSNSPHPTRDGPLPQYGADMAGLTDEERRQLEIIVGRRLGARSDAKVVVGAYLDAMARNAFSRTVESGPVPTSLVAERSAILIEISRQLGRVIEDFEIQALLRVAPSQARSMRATLLATYSDDADSLTLAWSMRGARQLGRLTVDGLNGTSVALDSEDRRDALFAYAGRTGVEVRVVTNDDAHPWAVVLADAFPKADLPPKA